MTEIELIWYHEGVHQAPPTGLHTPLRSPGHKPSVQDGFVGSGDLQTHDSFPGSGIVLLKYDVIRD